MNAGLKQALDFAPKMRRITDEVLVRNIGRQELIKVTWIGLISGRPVFALGPTGVNKTATIRQMAYRIGGAVFDERLIPAVKSAADLFVEATEIHERALPDGGKATSLNETLGRAANAHIFFGDEFFKDEDHPVLNSLIDFALEGVVRHEGGLFHTPLQLFVAAGNETPDPLGKLAAVWSRMTLRLVVRPLDRIQKKTLVLTRQARQRDEVSGQSKDGSTVMTLADVEVLHKVRPFVEIPESVIDTVLDIVDELGARTDTDFSNLIGDDRRFARIFDAMQAMALMNGRETIANSDLSVLKWTMWDTEAQIPALLETLAPYTRTAMSEAQELVNALMSPTGAVTAAKGGDITKGVAAISQAKAAIEQLEKLIDETEKAGENSMKSEIETLKKQVQGEMDEIIAKMTGRK